MKKNRGHLTAGQYEENGTERGRESEREREKAIRDRFHRVPFVRLLSHAKRNITSVALIKKATEKRKNNDASATALLKKDWQKKSIQSHNPIQLQRL